MQTLSDARLVQFVACLIVVADNISWNNFNQSDPWRIVVVGVGLLTMGLIVTSRIGAELVLGFTTCAGVIVRLTRQAIPGSDVMHATAEALYVLEHGGNPYAHYYLSTVPPGSPFAYLPGELAYYGIQAHTVGLNVGDRTAGLLILFGLAALAPVCGIAWASLLTSIYGSFEYAVLYSLDGSNDTALSLLVVASLIALAYGVRESQAGNDRLAAVLHVVSALLFGWALGFKALCWLVFPFMVQFVTPSRRRFYLLWSLGVFAIFCVPLFVWNPGAFVDSQLSTLTFHQAIHGLGLWPLLLVLSPSIAVSLDHVIAPLAVIVTCMAMYVLWPRKPTSLGESVARSALVLATLLFFVRWNTPPYFLFVFAVSCVAIGTWSVQIDNALADQGGHGKSELITGSA